MKPSDFTVTIREDSPRAADWMKVFGTLTVPVTNALSPATITLNTPGRQGETQAYFLDLKALTPQQRRRLVEHIATRFGAAPDQVTAQIDEHGVPILEEDTTAVIHNLQRYF